MTIEAASGMVIAMDVATELVIAIVSCVSPRARLAEIPSLGGKPAEPAVTKSTVSVPLLPVMVMELSELVRMSVPAPEATGSVPAGVSIVLNASDNPPPPAPPPPLE